MILKLVASVSIISLFGVHVFGLDTTPSATVSENLTHTSLPPSEGMDPEVRRIYLSMIQPEQIPLVTDSGRFIVSSVESYDVGAAGISGCSFIARKNIISLLSAFGPHIPQMAQGDANDLIRFGRHNRTLTSFSDKKAIIETLNTRKDTFVETVFDVYRHVPTRTYALQGHRVAVFLGEDERWYVLDTIDGEKTRVPQLFETYLANDVDDAEWLIRFPGYSFIDPIESHNFMSILSFFSDDVRQLFESEPTFVWLQPQTIPETEEIVDTNETYSLVSA